MNERGTWEPTVRTGKFKRRIFGSLLLLLLVVVIIVGGGFSWALGYFGIGLDRSLKEPVVAKYDGDSELAAQMSGYFDLLYSPDGIEIPTFRNSVQALKRHRFAMLAYLVRTDYKYYAGNEELTDQVRGKYGITPTICIPTGSFETVFYKYFGGTYPASHKSVQSLTYLKKVKMYVSSYQVQTVPADFVADAVEETEHYYILYGHTGSDTKQAQYRATFKKREEGFYLLALYRI